MERAREVVLRARLLDDPEAAELRLREAAEREDPEDAAEREDPEAPDERDDPDEREPPEVVRFAAEDDPLLPDAPEDERDEVERRLDALPELLRFADEPELERLLLADDEPELDDPSDFSLLLFLGCGIFPPE